MPVWFLDCLNLLSEGPRNIRQFTSNDSKWIIKSHSAPAIPNPDTWCCPSLTGIFNNHELGLELARWGKSATQRGSCFYSASGFNITPLQDTSTLINTTSTVKCCRFLMHPAMWSRELAETKLMQGCYFGTRSWLIKCIPLSSDSTFQDDQLQAFMHVTPAPWLESLQIVFKTSFVFCVSSGRPE